ncbi:dCTP deaminase [Nocardia gamkensis]|uniref:Deoxycytidine deaminase n=1 Tax=Nocardia gamkensis TaxID=352869 RepID=A0A7X6L5U5_9NOCA|nr:2'-deoxycytidine 5'-triphosphate deaminase [Nocardia gamkensis]NKY28234.1 deoxycytidine deaminase [Nocardia gamkensis]NQE70745.1 Deoxycytidine triphosphate deaminase [Nocardia gamkensis]
MILSGNAIREAVEEDRITIDPFDRRLLNPNSYNYRLGRFLKPAPPGVLDPRDHLEWPEFEIPDSGAVLEPGQLYLGHTWESIGSQEFVTILVGRSSVGRLGMFLQVSADLGHQGAVHSWTLELTVVQPVRVYQGRTIGQVSFWVADGAPTTYDGRYGRWSRPKEYIGAQLTGDLMEGEN